MYWEIHWSKDCIYLIVVNTNHTKIFSNTFSSYKNKIEQNMKDRICKWHFHFILSYQQLFFLLIVCWDELKCS